MQPLYFTLTLQINALLNKLLLFTKMEVTIGTTLKDLKTILPNI